MSIQRIAVFVLLLVALSLATIIAREHPRLLPQITLFSSWLTGVVVFPRCYKCVSLFALLTIAFWVLGKQWLL